MEHIAVYLGYFYTASKNRQAKTSLALGKEGVAFYSGHTLCGSAGLCKLVA
jgi:hypothetical protein